MMFTERKTHVPEQTLCTHIICAAAHKVFDRAVFCWKAACFIHKDFCHLPHLADQVSSVSYSKQNVFVSKVYNLISFKML